MIEKNQEHIDNLGNLGEMTFRVQIRDSNKPKESLKEINEEEIKEIEEIETQKDLLEDLEDVSN